MHAGAECRRVSSYFMLCEKCLWHGLPSHMVHCWAGLDVIQRTCGAQVAAHVRLTGPVLGKSLAPAHGGPSLAVLLHKHLRHGLS